MVRFPHGSWYEVQHETHCRFVDAATNATETCERNYGTAPQGGYISGSVLTESLTPATVIVKGATDLRIPHIPDHIHYILYELLKNSMRAVVERYTDLGKRDDLPPIEVSKYHGNVRRARMMCIGDICLVVISDGDDDIVMKGRHKRYGCLWHGYVF